jgi:hypothetical protein
VSSCYLPLRDPGEARQSGLVSQPVTVWTNTAVRQSFMVTENPFAQTLVSGTSRLPLLPIQFRFVQGEFAEALVGALIVVPDSFPVPRKGAWGNAGGGGCAGDPGHAFLPGTNAPRGTNRTWKRHQDIPNARCAGRWGRYLPPGMGAGASGCG